MTLDTRVYVLDEINYRDVWVKCNQLIKAGEHIRFTECQQKTYKDGKWAVYPDSPWWIWNAPGQGLCALLDLKYRPGAPLRSAEQAAACDEDCDTPCSGEYHDKACWLEVSFDTAYSARGDDGENCGDLHANLVAQLGVWLGEHRVRWMWRNEFTWEYHMGFEGLDQLGASGGRASDWFRSTVLPAIHAADMEV